MAEMNSVENQENPQAEAPQSTADAQTEASATPDAANEQEQTPDYPAFSGGMESKPGGEVSADNIGGMDLLRDVDLEVTVELGRTQLKFGDIMEMGQGSVIELDKMAGEPVDIRVNGILMASGEVIVLDDVFGVRITRLNTRVDRAQILG